MASWRVVGTERGTPLICTRDVPLQLTLVLNDFLLLSLLQ